MSKIGSNVNLLSKIPLYFFFLTAPFAVSSLFQSIIPVIPTSILILLLTFTFIFFYFLKVKKITLTRFEIKTLVLFFLPILLSLVGVLVALIYEDNLFYIEFIYSDFVGRMALVILNITIIIGLLNITSDWTEESVINLIRKYYYGLLILVLIGVWQFFHFMIGIPFINAETRSHIHSVKENSFIISQRLTSITNEPSYLAPLIIDLMILAFLVSKKPLRVIFLGLFVLIFSYSGGGYINLLIIVSVFTIGYIKFNNFRIKTTYLIFIGTLSLTFIILIFLYHESIFKLLYPVLGRSDTMFNLESDVRLYMSIMPFFWVLGGNFVNAIFGYGPSSFKYLNLTEIMPNGNHVHATSNNLFADALYELGFFGLICYLLFFVGFIFKSVKGLLNNRYYLISLMLTTHLIVSSLYRADYMQPRFWIIIFIILWLLKVGNVRRGDQN